MSNVRPLRSALFGAILCMPCGAMSATVGPFDALRWAMTVQEARSAYPSFETWKQQDVDVLDPKLLLTKEHFGLRSYWAEGCNFTVSLLFDENKLRTVSLEQIASSEAGSSRDCHDAVIADLSKKYGHNVNINQLGGQLSYSWSITKTEITAAPLKLRDGTYLINIVYTSMIWMDDLIASSKKNKF